MFGYSKDKFGCFITNIEDDIASITLCDKDGGKSYMDIPIDDLEASGVVCVTGKIFRLIVTQLIGWQKISLIPITKTKKFSLEEIRKLRDYYEEKYGDV